MKTWQILDYVCSGMAIRHKEYRAGQALFNALDLVCPEIADKIRGEDLDPFYDNARIPDCVKFIKKELGVE